MSDVLEKARKFLSEVEKENLEGIREIYHPDAVIRRLSGDVDNSDEGWSSNESVEMIRFFSKVFTGFDYDVWFREATEIGFVQRHILIKSSHPNMGELEVPICIKCNIEAGKITRNNESIDPAKITSFASSIMCD